MTPLGEPVLILVPLIASILVLVQNALMVTLGLKEMAIFAFPLSFTGILLAELAAIWTGYFCVRRFLDSRRALVLTAWTLVVLGAAELMLPVSYFTTSVRQSLREHVLGRIEQAGISVEPLASDRGGSRFALTYTLKFPNTAHFLTFPAYMGSESNRVFGDYFTKEHPEYYEEDYFFEAGKPYSFTVVFDTEGKMFDFSREKAIIDICDAKDYFMACRSIAIGLESVPAALAAHPAPTLLEPAVAAGNVRDITEKSIRLDALTLKSVATRTGEPVAFSYDITNIGKEEVAVPDGAFANIISVNYAWEPISDGAKTTRIIPGIVRLGNAVAAGGAQFVSVHKTSLKPDETVPLDDKITPFEPFAPGAYKLHVYLYSRYSTATNRPVQELVADFSVIP